MSCRRAFANLRNAPEQGDRSAGGFQPNLVIGHLGFNQPPALGIDIRTHRRQRILQRLHNLLVRHADPDHRLGQRTLDQRPLKNRVRFLLRSRFRVAGIFSSLDLGFARDHFLDEAPFPFIERLSLRAWHLPNPHLRIVSKEFDRQQIV